MWFELSIRLMRLRGCGGMLCGNICSEFDTLRRMTVVLALALTSRHPVCWLMVWTLRFMRFAVSVGGIG